jgi:chaperonin GroES
MKFKPLGDRALVKLVEREETTPSGIVLPDTAREKPQTAEVVAVGEGKLDDKGQRVPLAVSQGDVIVFARYSGTARTTWSSPPTIDWASSRTRSRAKDPRSAGPTPGALPLGQRRGSGEADPGRAHAA